MKVLVYFRDYADKLDVEEVAAGGVASAIEEVRMSKRKQIKVVGAIAADEGVIWPYEDLQRIEQKLKSK